MKTCTKCKREKPLAAFNKNKHRSDGHQTACRDCCKTSSRLYYKKNYRKQRKQISEARSIRRKDIQTQLLSYLEQHPCKTCGNSDIRVLEFDHRDRSTKDGSVSNFLTEGYGWSKIQREIEKCDVLCANCHRIKTHEENNSYRHNFGLLAQLARATGS